MKLFKISLLKFITHPGADRRQVAAAERCRDRGHRAEMWLLRPELPDAAIFQLFGMTLRTDRWGKRVAAGQPMSFVQEFP
jgi:hypothetical protein